MPGALQVRAAAWALCAVVGLALPDARAAASDTLYERVGERLALMQAVARYKWHNELPVADPGREAVVIDAAVADGLDHQFRPAGTAAFFRAQIEAAKDIQRFWFERWARDGAPAGEPDLERDIRPRLLALGEEILRLAAADGLTHDPVRFTRAVATDGLTAEHAGELFAALAAMERFPSRLDQILETGVLRVGTTGDYAPFSFSADGDSWAGADIDLARDLAAALGVEARFVPTSWPTLMDDLAAGRYDIAMSGVSRTVERARVGYLSSPYFVGGKLPIARCEDKRRFGTLAAIDQEGVRVIVNPGGTNEAFVDTRLTRAEKVLHADNRTIFAALAAGEADVMITDSIEVMLQAAKNPELCGTMGRTLTYQEKAYLMPRDDALKTFVDTWLSLRLGDGTVDARIEAHLSL